MIFRVSLKAEYAMPIFSIDAKRLCILNRFRTPVGIYSEPGVFGHCFTSLAITTPNLFRAGLRVMTSGSEGFKPATKADLMQIESAHLPKPPFAGVLKLCCLLGMFLLFSVILVSFPCAFLSMSLFPKVLFSCWQCHCCSQIEVRL